MKLIRLLSALGGLGLSAVSATQAPGCAPRDLTFPPYVAPDGGAEVGAGDAIAALDAPGAADGSAADGQTGPDTGRLGSGPDGGIAAPPVDGATAPPGDAPAAEVVAATDAAADGSSRGDAPVGVPCPSSLAGNGQPCATPGEGCGGGDRCGDSYACTCMPGLRWQCQVQRGTCDAGPPADTGSAPDTSAVPDAASARDTAPPPDAAPPGCPLVGTYSFRSPILLTMYLRMRADGQWAYATNTAALDRSALNGTWSQAADLVTIREPGASLEGCSPSAVGTYRVSFSPGCGAATLHLVSDACSLRGTLLGGRSFNRLGG